MKKMVFVLLLSCVTDITFANAGSICHIDTVCGERGGHLRLSIDDRVISITNLQEGYSINCNVNSQDYPRVVRNFRKMARDLKAAKHCDVVLDETL